MALIKPDFSEVADAVTPGVYMVIVKKGDLKSSTTQSGDTWEYINWEMETVGETDPKNNGRRIYMKTPISGKGAFRLQELYRAATSAALTGSFDTEQLVGKTVKIEVVDGVNRQTGEPTGYTEVKKVIRAM